MEKNTKSLSVSFRVDSGIVSHNNRDFIAKNVDSGRIKNNITYVRQDIHEVYNELFGTALAEYNAKQKKASRKITDYYEHIQKSDRVKPYYEIVVQFGDIESCGQNSGRWEQAKLMLDEYIRGFEQRNPNLKVFNAVMHLDEATPHLHIDFIPIAHKVKSGLSVKVSMKGALQEQGFSAANRLDNEWKAWEESERDVMISILHSHDLSRDVKNINRAHLDVDDYKRYAAQQLEVKKLNEQINKLKQKNSEDITADEVSLIINQNDVMRSEIMKRDEKIADLSRKINAKLVPYNIYSDELLQFVTAELDKSNIKYIEDSTAVYVPEYALEMTKAISDTFRPVDKSSIRDKIKLDIDRLVYTCNDFDDLLDKLRERGYKIKHGKYIAIKPPFGEKFIRMRSLGFPYLQNNLEKRMAEKDIFINSVKAKSAELPVFAQSFTETVIDMTVEIKHFRLAPKKYDKGVIYVLDNDSNISNIANQLLTISDYNIHSSEQMYDMEKSVKQMISDLSDNVKSHSDEIATLKSDISQLHFLFSALSVSSKRMDAMTKTKIAAAQQIANRRGITTEEEITALEKMVDEVSNAIRSAKSELSEEQKKLKRVNELIDTYEKIVKGNYIDNLIKAQKELARGSDSANLKKQ